MAKKVKIINIGIGQPEDTEREYQSAESTTKAMKILDRFGLYKNGSWQDWAARIGEDVSFTTPGGQWTTEEREVLQARGQAALEINVINPQIDFIKSQLIATAPQFKVIPRLDDNVKTANAFSKILYYNWYRSNGDDQVEWAVDNQLKKGKGYLYVEYDQFGDDGYPIVTMKSIDPLSVVCDPNSHSPDEEDADYKFHFKMISRGVAKTLWPTIAAKIDSIRVTGLDRLYSRGDRDNAENIPIGDESDDDTIGNDNGRLMLIEQLHKIPVKYYIITYNDGSNTIERELSESEFEAFKKELEADPVGNKDIVNAITKLSPIYKNRVERVVVLGDYLLSESTLPTATYPIIPLPYRHWGNPYTSSLTRDLKGLQEEINHRRSLMIAHSAASAGAKLLIPNGSVNDIDEFEENWNRPLGVNTYNPDPTTQDKPMLIQPVPLSNSLFMLEDRAKADVEFLSGSFRFSHGDAGAAPDTYRATVFLDEKMNRRMSILSRVIYRAVTAAGRIMIDYVQAYFTTPRIFRLINPYDANDNNVETVTIGEIFGMKDAANIKDPSIGRYDVQVIIGSMAPNNRWEELNMYRELFKDGLIDDIEVLKKTDIFDRDGLMKRKSQMSQLIQQLEQMQNAAKALNRELEETRDQLENAKLEVESAQADKMLDREKTRLQQSYAEKELQLQKAINLYEVKLHEVSANAKSNGKTAKTASSKKGS